MKPVNFKESNLTLKRPPSMTDAECAPLHIYQSMAGMVSCWRPTWRERLAILFGAPLWLWVLSERHPPVAVEIHNPFKSPFK